MTQQIPKPVIRELIESGTVPLSKRDSFSGRPIPVSSAREIIEEALGFPEVIVGRKFGGTGRSLERLADGTIALHQSVEFSLGKMQDQSEIFTDPRKAIDSYLKHREKDFPEIPAGIRFDWNK